MTGYPAERGAADEFVRAARSSYRLSGKDAVAWLRARGGDLGDLPGAGSFHMVVEELCGGSFLGRRIWHTAGRLRYLGGGDRSEHRLLLQVDGAIELTSRGQRTTVTANDVALLRSTAAVDITSDAPSARFEVTTSIPPNRRAGPVLLLPASAPTPAATALASLVNAVMNAEPAPDHPVLSALIRAIEAAVDALVVERSPRSTASRSAHRTYEEALLFIRTWGHSPTLTVPVVVEAMHVSRQYLTKVFTDRGTTIGGEIRRHRVRLARRLLAHGLVSVSEAAEASGFSSILAMRRAIRRVHEEDRAAGRTEDATDQANTRFHAPS